MAVTFPPSTISDFLHVRTSDKHRLHANFTVIATEGRVEGVADKCHVPERS